MDSSKHGGTSLGRLRFSEQSQGTHTRQKRGYKFKASSSAFSLSLYRHFKSMKSSQPPFPSSHLDSTSDTDSDDHEHGPRLTVTQEDQLKVESQVAEIYRSLVGIPLHRQSVA